MKLAIRELLANITSPFRLAKKLDQLVQQQAMTSLRHVQGLDEIVEIQAQQLRLLKGMCDQSDSLFPQRGELGWDDPRSPTSLFRSACLRAQAETLDVIQKEMSEAVCELDHRSFLISALSHALLDGAVLEFGVFTGTTLRWMAEADHKRQFFGFDSFTGLPEAWAGYKTFDFHLDAKPPSLPANVNLVTGQFQDTLPTFVALGLPISMIHIDCDLYSSAHIVLESLASYLRSGTVLVFDEYFNYPGYREHEYRACREFLARTGRRMKWLSYSGERTAGILQ